MQVLDLDGVLLAKYGLQSDDAILAEERHKPMYREIVEKYKVTYVAGGAAQNTARGAAYILPPHTVVFTGCVGDDDFAEQLLKENVREGLDNVYIVEEGEPTGVCAVVISRDHRDRSLVTTLGAAKKFVRAHLDRPGIVPLVECAQIFYVEGYVLSHAADAVLDLGQKASEQSKTFVLNFSAPYIPRAYLLELQQIIPFCDIVICNVAEAASWATATGLPDPEDHAAVARAIATLPKSNASRPRLVVITDGPKSTTVVSAADPDSPAFYPVEPVPQDEIVDTNGAGDAFSGGFLGALVAGRSIDECVGIGHKLGAMCVRQVGPQYAWPRVPIL